MGDEITPLFCVFQQFFRCVAGTTVQSGCLFTATIEEQLVDKFFSVFRGLVFLHSAFSLSHPDSFSVDTRPSTLVAWPQGQSHSDSLHCCFQPYPDL